MAFILSIYRYFIIPNVIVALINILMNSFLIHALRRLKKLQSISHKLFLSLSISDVCISVSLLLTEPAFCLVDEKNIYIVRICSGISLFAFCQFSALAVLSVAGDRYIHMKYLNKYNTIMTNRKAVIIVIVNIFVSILSTAVALTGPFLEFGFISSLVPSLGLLGVLAIATILYLKAYRSVKRRTLSIVMRRRKAKDLVSEVGPVTVVRRNPSQEFSKSVLFVLGSLWIFYTPTVIFTALNNSNLAGAAVSVCFYTSLLLMYMNASLNVVIFISFNRQLRNYTLQKLGCFFPGSVVPIDESAPTIVPLNE